MCAFQFDFLPRQSRSEHACAPNKLIYTINENIICTFYHLLNDHITHAHKLCLCLHPFYPPPRRHSRSQSHSLACTLVFRFDYMTGNMLVLFMDRARASYYIFGLLQNVNEYARACVHAPSQHESASPRILMYLPIVCAFDRWSNRPCVFATRRCAAS